MGLVHLLGAGFNLATSSCVNSLSLYIYKNNEAYGIKSREVDLRQDTAAGMEGAGIPFVIEALGPLWAQQRWVDRYST